MQAYINIFCSKLLFQLFLLRRVSWNSKLLSYEIYLNLAHRVEASIRNCDLEFCVFYYSCTGFPIAKRLQYVYLTGVNKRVSCKHFFDHLNFNITITGTLYNYMKLMLMFYEFKASSIITTGKDLHTYNTSHCTNIDLLQTQSELAAALSQNIWAETF